jgi:hypothetical protein
MRWSAARPRVRKLCNMRSGVYAIARASAASLRALRALPQQAPYDLCAAPLAAYGDRHAVPAAASFRLSRPRLLSQRAPWQAPLTLRRRPTRERRTCFAVKPFPTRSFSSFQALHSLAGFLHWHRLVFARHSPVRKLTVSEFAPTDGLWQQSRLSALMGWSRGDARGLETTVTQIAKGRLTRKLCHWQ